MHKINVVWCFAGLMNCPLGSRTSTVTTTVQKNSSGCRCSVPRPSYPTARMPRVPHLHQADRIYLCHRYYPKKILSELAKGERSSNGIHRPHSVCNAQSATESTLEWQGTAGEYRNKKIGMPLLISWYNKSTLSRIWDRTAAILFSRRKPKDVALWMAAPLSELCDRETNDTIGEYLL